MAGLDGIVIPTQIWPEGIDGRIVIPGKSVMFAALAPGDNRTHVQIELPGKAIVRFCLNEEQALWLAQQLINPPAAQPEDLAE